MRHFITLELKPYQENRGIRGVYDKRNRINNLTGKEWVFSTRSVKTKEFKFITDLKKAFMFDYYDFMPVELINDLIQTFVKPGSTIVDPNCNFGSSSIAVGLNDLNYTYFGFNFHNNQLIDHKPKTNSQIHLNEKSYEISKIKCIPDLVFSELIFSTVFPEKRNIEINSWLKDIILYLKMILPSIVKNTYFIFGLQNTRFNKEKTDEFRYISNVSPVNTELEKLNLLLKAELIWKIPDNYINVLKSVLKNKFRDSTDFSFLLNDKRILIYKLEF